MTGSQLTSPPSEAVLAGRGHPGLSTWEAGVGRRLSQSQVPSCGTCHLLPLTAAPGQRSRVTPGWSHPRRPSPGLGKSPRAPDSRCLGRCWRAMVRTLLSRLPAEGSLARTAPVRHGEITAPTHVPAEEPHRWPASPSVGHRGPAFPLHRIAPHSAGRWGWAGGQLREESQHVSP